MTHKHVEIRPSSRINLLLGHNGTGKSSIVCAICLGLGGEPTDMARSADLQGYILTGATKASVMIQLQGPPGGGDITVTRVLTQTKPHSQWMLDGKAVSVEAVKAKMRNLHIQMSNPTQFLPQELVGKFSEMNPQKLLKHTLQAVSADLHGAYQGLAQDFHAADSESKALSAVTLSKSEAVNKREKLSSTMKKWEAYHKLEREVHLCQAVQLHAALRDELNALADKEAAKDLGPVRSELAAVSGDIPALAAEVAHLNARRSETEGASTRAHAAQKAANDLITSLSASLQGETDGLQNKCEELGELEKNAAVADKALAKMAVTEKGMRERLEAHQRDLEKHPEADAPAKLRAAAEASEARHTALCERYDAAKEALATIKKAVPRLTAQLQKEEATRSKRVEALGSRYHAQGDGGWKGDFTRMTSAPKFAGDVVFAPIVDMEVLKPGVDLGSLEEAVHTSEMRGAIYTNKKDKKAVNDRVLCSNTAELMAEDVAEGARRAEGAGAGAAALRALLPGLGDLEAVLDCVRLPPLALAVLCTKSEGHKKYVTGNKLAADIVADAFRRNHAAVSRALAGCTIYFPTGSLSYFHGSLSRDMYKPPFVFAFTVDKARVEQVRGELARARSEEEARAKELAALDKEKAAASKDALDTREAVKRLTTARAGAKATAGSLAALQKAMAEHEASSKGGAEGTAQIKMRLLGEVREGQLKATKIVGELAEAVARGEEAMEKRVTSRLQAAWDKILHEDAVRKHSKAVEKKKSLEQDLVNKDKAVAKIRTQAEEEVRFLQLAAAQLPPPP